MLADAHRSALDWKRTGETTIFDGVEAARGIRGLALKQRFEQPDDKKLPAVLTREEIARLFTTVREPRFQMVLRLIYACGLRNSEAFKLEVTEIKKDGPRLYIRRAKGRKDRYVPLPMWAYRELRAWWKTHRHPKWVFPGWAAAGATACARRRRWPGPSEPMGDGSIQHCMRLVVAVARLPKGTCTHTLRHSYGGCAPGKNSRPRRLGVQRCGDTIRIRGASPSVRIPGLVQHESCDGCCVTQLSELGLFNGFDSVGKHCDQFVLRQ